MKWTENELYSLDAMIELNWSLDEIEEKLNKSAISMIKKLYPYLAKEYQKEYRQKPEIKQQHQEYNQNYYQRPEIKQHRKEYRQKPEIKQRNKEYNKEYYQENKQKIKEYFKRPEIKQHRKEYRQKPEIKQHKKEYNKEYRQKPENKQKIKEYNKEYRQKPEIKQRNKEYYIQKKYFIDLQEILNICDYINEPRTAGTALTIYEELRKKGLIFHEDNHYLHSIINYSLILDQSPQKIKELAEHSGTRKGRIVKTREKYRHILLY